MVDRSVEVRLRLDISNFQAQSLAAAASLTAVAAAAERLDNRLDRVSTSSQVAARRLRAQDRAAQGLNTNLGNLNTTLGQHQSLLNQNAAASNAFVRNNQQSGASINQLTGRLGAFADAAVILGPGLIPIGAVGVQAIMGLVNAAGALVTVGVSAVAAFQGVGDAVKAVDAYQLEPTAANLEKAQQAMEKLGPDAARFVMEFQDFQPVLTGLRDAAAEGWFPGLTESLDDWEKVAPLVERIFRRSGMAGGDIVGDMAESLGSDRWRPFMRFIGEEAPTAMHALATISGDLAHGFAEMWMSFDPGNDAFLGWLGDVASGFDSWASSTEGRDDIEGFLAYARENGPEVAELFSSLVSTTSSLVQAAAPLGGPVLTALTAVLDVVGGIADSDMATPILAAVAAWRILARLAPMVAGAQARMAASTAAMTGPRATGVTTPTQAYWLSQQPAALAAAAARRQALVRGGGMALGAGLLASGAASDLGMTNTALLALAGSMAGPWGAAAGAGVGLAMDFAAANDDLEAAIERVNQTAGSADFSSMGSQIASVQTEIDKLRESSDDKNIFQKFAPLSGIGIATSAMDWMKGNDADEGEAELARLEARMQSTQEAAAGLGTAMGMTIGPLDGSARSVRELEAAVAMAQPAMDALGISFEELAAAKAREKLAASDSAFVRAGAAAADEAAGSYDEMGRAIAAQAEHMDSAAGKTENYEDALRGLGEAATDAATEAENLGAALDALLDPNLDAMEATDNYVRALRGLRKELAGGAGFQGNAPKALDNRQQAYDYVDTVKDRLVAMAEAGRSEREMAAAVRDSRTEFIAAAEAAGINAGQIRWMVRQMGLTPKLVRTTFEALGIDETDLAIRSLKAAVKGMPKEQRTAFRAEAVPKTMAEIDALVKKYKLTEEQRTALVTLRDEASGKARSIQAAINAVKGKSVTITTVHRDIRVASTAGVSANPTHNADGGSVPKTGLPYADRHAYMLADGEEVTSNRFGQADRYRRVLKAINANLPPVQIKAMLAGGGTAGLAGPLGRQSSGGMSWDPVGVTLDTLADAASGVTGGLKGLRKALAESERALAKEQQKRQDMLSYRDQVGGSLAGDLFGNGLAGFDLANEANGNDAEAMTAALAKLRKKGLDGPLYDLIASSGDLTTAQQLANESAAGIDQREKAYASTERAERDLGTIAMVEKFDTTLAKQERTIDRLEASTKDLTRELRKLEKAVERGAKNGTREGRRDGAMSLSTRTRAGR